MPVKWTKTSFALVHSNHEKNYGFQLRLIRLRGASNRCTKTNNLCCLARYHGVRTMRQMWTTNIRYINTHKFTIIVAPTCCFTNVHYVFLWDSSAEYKACWNACLPCLFRLTRETLVRTHPLHLSVLLRTVQQLVCSTPFLWSKFSDKVN